MAIKKVQLPDNSTQDINDARIASTDITQWNGKQDALVSGTNIKTVNGESLLGGGDLTITGSPGADGVGIASVVQTTESTVSGGTNVITVTKSDGSTSTVKVRNGDAVGSVPIVQTTGTATDAAMSQDAVTRELTELDKRVPTAFYGPNTGSTFVGVVMGEYNVADFPNLDPRETDEIAIVFGIPSTLTYIDGSVNSDCLTLEDTSSGDYISIGMYWGSPAITSRVNGTTNARQRLLSGVYNAGLHIVGFNFKTGLVTQYAAGKLIGTQSYDTSKIPDISTIDKVTVRGVTSRNISYLGVMNYVPDDDEAAAIFSLYPDDIVPNKSDVLTFGSKQFDMNNFYAPSGLTVVKSANSYAFTGSTSGDYALSYAYDYGDITLADWSTSKIKEGSTLVINSGSLALKGIGGRAGTLTTYVYDSGGTLLGTPTSANPLTLTAGTYTLITPLLDLSGANTSLLYFTLTGSVDAVLSDAWIKSCGFVLLFTPSSYRGTYFEMPNGDQVPKSSTLEVRYNVMYPKCTTETYAQYNGQLKLGNNGQIYAGYISGTTNVWKQINNS